MKNNWAIGIAVVALIGVVFLGIKEMTQDDDCIVYVRTQVLIDEYLGTKEAQQILQQKKSVWQSNLDTLKADYHRAISQYNQEYSQLSTKERSKKEELLQLQNESLIKYAQSLDQQASKEDEQLTRGILRQIDDYVKQYAEDKGIDFILGTTTTGNILFGDEGLDITDEVLKALNNHYQGKED